MSNRCVCVVGLAILLVAVGCKRGDTKPGRWLACTCSYLTDYDDIAKLSIDVCVEDGTNTMDAAVGCASKLAHGHVDSCSCGQLGETCAGLRECRSSEN
ncbi:MAG: hypothetical protein FWD57_08695 [Polyangiaceae bacterium]|nr:hypothetical protein [Polyangiaceae bacterium]